MTTFNEIVESTRSARWLEDKLQESGGEITPEIEILMNAVGDISTIAGRLPEKVSAINQAIKRLERESDYWRGEADARMRMSRGCSRAVDRLKDMVKQGMLALGENVLNGSDCRFQLTPTQKRLVLEENRLPVEYKMAKMELVPDKEKIREELEAGRAVEGAKLEGGFALRNYIGRKE